MARIADFNTTTKRRLAQRVGYLCSNPDCRRRTVGPNEDPTKRTLIGEAAHIRGASPGSDTSPSSARYDPDMTDEERSDISNGLWLCSVCHTMIDADEKKYPVELLQGWKVKAESLAGAELGERITTAVAGLQLSYIRYESAALPESIEDLQDLDGLPPGSWVPHLRNAVFTGREKDLFTLAKKLLYEPETVGATGSGGIGKTQLAVEFCYRYGRYFRGVHWISANEDIPAGIARCGEKMGLEPWPGEIPDQVRLALQAMALSGPRLVVLDNLEDPEILEHWLAEFRDQRILVTARREKWPVELSLHQHQVGIFNKDDSRKLLRSLAKRLKNITDEELEEVGERFGYLPLAIDLAGRYLNDRKRLSVDDFLEEITEAGSALLHQAFIDWAESSPTKHARDLVSTFVLSWNALDETEEAGKMAQHIMRICGYLAPNIPIPVDLLIALSIGESDIEALIDKALKRITAIGLLREAEAGLVIHPLLAEFARLEDGSAIKSVLPTTAKHLLDLAVRVNQLGLPKELTTIRAHLRAMAEYTEIQKINIAADIWYEYGNHLYQLAEYPEARDAFLHALAIDKVTLGPDHPKVARDINNLGLVLKDMGDLIAARDAFERALTIDEAIYGPDYPKVATDVNNLGLVLHDLGDLTEARNAFERARVIFEEWLGSDDPHVAIIINNLGSVLHDLGELNAARNAYQRALDIDEVAYGSDHPAVARDCNNLGLVLKDLGDLNAAQDTIKRALVIDEAAFGPDHLNVARDFNNLGLVLHDLGDLKAARDAYERALVIIRNYLPENHPKLTSVENNLKTVNDQLEQLEGN